MLIGDNYADQGHVCFKGSDKNIIIVHRDVLRWQRYPCIDEISDAAINADNIIRIYINDGIRVWTKSYENRSAFNVITYSLTLKNVTAADNDCYRLLKSEQKDTYVARVIGK